VAVGRNQLQPVGERLDRIDGEAMLLQMRAQQAEEPTVVFDRKEHACAIGPDDQRTGGVGDPGISYLSDNLNIVNQACCFAAARLVPPRAASSVGQSASRRRSGNAAPDPNLVIHLIVFARPELRTLAGRLRLPLHRRGSAR